MSMKKSLELKDINALGKSIELLEEVLGLDNQCDFLNDLYHMIDHMHATVNDHYPTKV